MSASRPQVCALETVALCLSGRRFCSACFWWGRTQDLFLSCTALYYQMGFFCFLLRQFGSLLFCSISGKQQLSLCQEQLQWGSSPGPVCLLGTAFGIAGTEEPVGGCSWRSDVGPTFLRIQTSSEAGAVMCTRGPGLIFVCWAYSMSMTSSRLSPAPQCGS